MATLLSNTIDNLLENTGDMALKRRARLILSNINPQSGETILEVGCGDGYYLHMLSNIDSSLKLFGTDYDKRGLAAAGQNLIGKKVKLSFGDLMKKLPYKSNTFDKIIMSEVAEHLPDDVKGLKEVCRILKMGGTLCLTVPNHNYPIFWDPVNWILEHVFGTHIKTGFWSGLWNMHIRLYTPDQIALVVEKAGFKILDIQAPTFWTIPFGHNITHLGARILHSGKMPKVYADSINKFKSPTHKPFLTNAYFWLVNTVDKLNDIWTPHKNWGVGVFVKAVK
jgi:ubiquinone/menaquinone biosynthesis C-methylase UbiE